MSNFSVKQIINESENNLRAYIIDNDFKKQIVIRYKNVVFIVYVDYSMAAYFVKATIKNGVY